MGDIRMDFMFLQGRTSSLDRNRHPAELRAHDGRGDAADPRLSPAEAPGRD